MSIRLVAAIGLALGVASTLATPASARGAIDRCYDPQGRPVRVIKSTKVKFANVAIAGRDRRGLPYIAYNPNALRRFHPMTRIYIYYHECAHHRLGHSSGHRPHTRESDADCWAIRYMVRRGLLNRASLRFIVRDTYSRRGGGVHPAGPVRARYIQRCYSYEVQRVAMNNNRRYRGRRGPRTFAQVRLPEFTG